MHLIHQETLGFYVWYVLSGYRPQQRVLAEDPVEPVVTVNTKGSGEISNIFRKPNWQRNSYRCTNKNILHMGWRRWINSMNFRVCTWSLERPHVWRGCVWWTWLCVLPSSFSVGASIHSCPKSPTISWHIRAEARLSSSESAAWSLRRSPWIPPAELLSGEHMADASVSPTQRHFPPVSGQQETGRDSGNPVSHLRQQSNQTSALNDSILNDCAYQEESGWHTSAGRVSK